MSEFGFTSVPDLVPARMVNEFSYCPRLFYIEWVESRFADNTDTVDGRWKHRVVDTEGGAAPLPGEGELKVARSVMLSSPELGLVGKADLIEGVGDAVVPVDYKRGSPPDTPDGAWEPERVQLCVLGLLLRDAGYRCDEGVLYFVESKQRVTVVFDDELIARTQELIGDLRRVAASSTAPPPLLDSPKCPRCSLVTLCLPDETNALAARSNREPRRLIARHADPRPLYVTEQGAWVGKSKGRIEITKHKELLHSVRFIDVSQICVFGNVQVSTQLLRQLFAEEIPVCWFSYGGWFSGIAEGLPSKHVELRRRQAIRATDGSIEIARRMIQGKIRNSRTLLRRNAKEKTERAIEQLKVMAESAATATSIDSLLGIEGAAARVYFQSFSLMIREDKRLPGQPFNFELRNRRPPKDAVNCLLSYVYGLLAKDCTATLFTVGLDPYLGLLHRSRFGRPALALDLAEEFRPIIAESVVINLINNGEVKPNDFIVRAGGVALTADGRKAVLGSYERRLEAELTHPLFGYKASYRRTLEIQARLLGAHLLGETPEYTPIVTR